MAAQPRNMLQKFFAGISEHTFQCQLGVADPPLVDYVADLLVRFIRSDAVYRIRNLTGQPIAQVAILLSESEKRVGEAKRDVHRHIGDFTLFWAGVYPETLRRMQNTTQRDHLIDYCQQGKRSYWIASQMSADENADSDKALFERLSQQFEMCAYGLREIRREWERRDDQGDSPTPLLWN